MLDAFECDVHFSSNKKKNTIRVIIQSFLIRKQAVPTNDIDSRLISEKRWWIHSIVISSIVRASVVASCNWMIRTGVIQLQFCKQ